MQEITIVGLGYMGLPTGLLLAKAGYLVKGYDIDKDKIALLKEGKLPFKEKGLTKLFEFAKKNFNVESRLEKSDVFIITVPTPFTSDKKCDTSFIISAVENISSVLSDGNLVVLESTVSPGTTINKVKPILDKTGKEYHLAYVSEKAIPGNTLYEMEHNHRIIGGKDKLSAKKAKKIYSSFVKGPVHLTDCTTAETAKLLENTYRDVNIALANEFAKLSSGYKINVWEAIELANHHPRVNIHFPGPGVGGHCIAIDPWFLAKDKKESPLITTARKINDSMPIYVFQKIKRLVKKGDIISILGVAYKKNVDDARESPALEIIERCKEYGLKVKVNDPYVKGYEKDLNKVLQRSKLVVIVTGHDVYTKVDFKIKVIDCCNLGIKGAMVLGDYKKD